MSTMDWNEMFMEHAIMEDLPEINKLYRAASKRPMCVWNDFYPGELELNQDFQTKNLYVLRQDNRIIGAVSVVPENELDEFDFWQVSDDTVKEIARVVVDERYQGQGIAGKMVASVLERLRKQGCKSVHLSVVDENIPAYKTYLKLGFQVVGEADMYGGHYFLCEKLV